MTLAQLDEPMTLYADLGCKTAVGFPFKDIATVDSIVLEAVPAAEDEARRQVLRRLQSASVGILADAAALEEAPIPGAVAVYDLDSLRASGGALPEGALRAAVRVTGAESVEELALLKDADLVAVLLDVDPALSRMHASRRVFEFIQRWNLELPVVHVVDKADVATAPTMDELTIGTGMEVGCMLVDGYGDGIMLRAPQVAQADDLRRLSFALLQGSRMRNTKTEFVSCPSCGRTLFDLQTVTAQIAERTGHLPGVSIAVMGCIVNGPGEMADADFGYVGGAPGKIDLYVGKEVVKRAIPMEEACDELVQLIKDYDRWVDPAEESEEAAVEEEAVPASA